MLNIHSSSDLDLLFDRFINDLEFPDDPLEPLWVIIQNKETQEWLNLRISERLGISANIKYILPSEFLWTLYRAKDQSLKDELPSDKNAMIWAIYEILLRDGSPLPYHNSRNWSAQRFLDISTQLADVFDLYQNYRPEMLEHWLKGMDLPQNHSWQVKIWKQLNDLWKSKKVWKINPRRSEAFADLIEWTQKGIIDNKIPSQIILFGVSNLNKPLLDLLCELSGRINIKLYTFECFSANSEPGFLNHLNKWCEVKTEQLNYLTESADKKGVEVTQERHYANLEITEHIQIHSCHSPEREVEVLKNEILKALENDHTLQLEDMIIMVPDPDLYGQLIHGIFTDPKRGRNIPVTDITSSGEHDLTDSFELILKLFNSDFKSGWISEIFMDPVLSARFGMNEEDVSILEKWLRDANVYHGFGDKFNTSYSWKKSLSQLMLGLIMHPSETFSYKSIIPLNNVSSASNTDIIAGYSEFIRIIEEHREILSFDKSVGEWIIWLQKLAADLFNDVDRGDYSADKLKRLIEKLRIQSQYHKGSLKLSYTEFSKWFLNELPGIKARSGRFGQGITVSTYVPYRSVPFRWISVLGMNEGNFPAIDIRPEFDLISADPGIGDRVQKDDDSLWFAETLAAAGDGLFISYAGRDQKNDREMLPSILVQQLMDHLKEGESFTFTKHPLHPFSRKYFSEQYDFTSYDQYSAEILNQFSSPEPPPVFISQNTLPMPEIRDEIHFTELISFFKNPSRDFLKGQMGIDFRDDRDQLKERENFEFSGLDKYLIDQKIFELRMKGLDVNSIMKYLKAKDLITGDRFNLQLVNNEFEVVNSLINEIEAEQNKKEAKVDLDLKVAGVKIYGKLGGIFDDQFISYRVGKDNAPVLVDHWIRYLLAGAAEVPLSAARFIFKESSSSKVKIHSHRSTDFKNLIRNLVEWYVNKEGLSDLNFFPEVSRVYAEAIHKDKEFDYAIGKAALHYTGSEYVRGEITDFHVKTLWKGRDPVSDTAFTENALRFWDPFLNSTI